MHNPRTPCGVIRHSDRERFLKHLGGNRWTWTGKLDEAEILKGERLWSIMALIPGCSWLPTKGWKDDT